MKPCALIRLGALLAGLTAGAAAGGAPAGGATAFDGRWTLLPFKSSQMDIFRTVTLDLKQQGSDIVIDQVWGGHPPDVHRHETLKTDGSVNREPVTSRDWPTRESMGVAMQVGSKQRVTAKWSGDGRTLTVARRYTVLVSQGPRQVENTEIYTLGPGDDLLTLDIARSTRKGSPILHYAFKRAGTKEAYVMQLGNHWQVKGDLDQNALLISLQGLANTDAPRLYLLYPEDWEFRFTPGLYDFYQQGLDYTFTQLTTTEQALQALRAYVRGYIVWDQNVRNSLDVAFTLAGLKRGVVVSAEQIPLMKKLGFKELADLRGEYEGMDDEQLFRKAYAQYGAQCSRGTIAWMGGVSGAVMKPAIADYAIAHRAFVADLSTSKDDPGEYALAREILSKQKPLSMVFGWHSYAKDLEREFVTLTSSFALRVEGLNTFPDLSFTSKTPPEPGFKFINHHNVIPGKVYQPGKKVYITCLQSDGLGLGAWSLPGRGSMPYAYEVTINWQWMAPAMLEYYYSTATKNDFFIGALSGPGYMYPQAIPRQRLPKVVSVADTLMRKLDLNVFETMDYSQGWIVGGHIGLPKYIVDAYYQGMPDAIGFCNGYHPGFTFASRDGRPFISFDYYLSQTRSETGVVHDLEELAKMNRQRPYFLLIHVREWNSIKRVKSILDRLGPDFKVVPMDVFMKLAGQAPTFQTRYYPWNPPASK